MSFHGCSFKSVENKWEYSSASAFSSYTKNFLMDNGNIASDDLQRAIKYAKKSADLNQLASIYLGKCALNIGVGINDLCDEYKELEQLINSSELKVYFLMLQDNLKEEQITYLPKQYHSFIKYKFLKKYKKAFESIQNMQQTSSIFISASLIKEEISKTQVKYLIEKASYYGYKKVVLFWLEHLKNMENNLKEKEKLEKKLEILKS